MGKSTNSPMVDQAGVLLHLFKNSSDSELTHHADDLLTYFRLLHDKYVVAKSTSPRFSGNTFNVLGEVIYQLESDPDGTIKNEEYKSFIILVLEDIALRRVHPVQKTIGKNPS